MSHISGGRTSVFWEWQQKGQISSWITQDGFGHKERKTGSKGLTFSHSGKPRDRGSSKMSWCRGSIMWGHLVSFSVGLLLVISDGCSSSWYHIFIWQCPKVVKSKVPACVFWECRKALQNSSSRSRGSVTLHTQALPILFKGNTITW